LKVRRTSNNGGVRQLAVAVAGLDGLTGKVGYFESAKYADGTPVALVATVNEFGSASQGIPARPTMRPAIAKNSPEWARQFGLGAAACARGKRTPFEVMDLMGQKAAGDVKREIADLQSPALDPDTIAARRRRYADKKATGNLSKPLVDTGIMINSVTNETSVAG
jgi:hypothetical protein